MARAIVMPSYGMYTVDGTLLQWLKPTGADVVAGEVIAEIETDKVTAELVAPETGILHHVATPGTLLQVEQLVGYVLAVGETAPAEGVHEPAPAVSPEPVRLATTAEGPAAASPNARRLAAELGVDLAGIRGTGPGGRISELDVRAAAEGRAT